MYEVSIRSGRPENIREPEVVGEGSHNACEPG